MYNSKKLYLYKQNLSEQLQKTVVYGVLNLKTCQGLCLGMICIPNLKGIQSKCFSHLCNKFLTDLLAKSNFSCGCAYIIMLTTNTFGQNRVFWFRRYRVAGLGYNRCIVDKTPFWVLLTLNNKNSK